MSFNAENIYDLLLMNNKYMEQLLRIMTLLIFSDIGNRYEKPTILKNIQLLLGNNL